MALASLGAFAGELEPWLARGDLSLPWRPSAKAWTAFALFAFPTAALGSGVAVGRGRPLRWALGLLLVPPLWGLPLAWGGAQAVGVSALLAFGAWTALGSPDRRP